MNLGLPAIFWGVFPWPGGNAEVTRGPNWKKGKLRGQGLSPAFFKKNNPRGWNVMFIHRKPGELYLPGTLPAFKGPSAFRLGEKN
ncbi:MAG: hypothetical protein CM15mP74_14590 [Halieaceae bacterium]|nr:MAG: hypothetical protein CM15mP74_14590 [Halieaceae bacterium]